MKWVFTFRVIPPTCVVSARDGGNIFFAAYSKWLKQWYLCANGKEEAIPEPQMLFLDDDYVKANPSSRFDENYSQIVPKRRKKNPQLELSL